MSIEKIDKLTETYSVRIPEILSEHLKQLSPAMKKRLNEDLLLVMAKHVHEASFDPGIYLCADDVHVYIAGLANRANKVHGER